MKKFINIIIISCAVVSVSCQKWLDVNVNPNAVTSVDNGLVIPAIELNILTNYGLYGHLLGSYFSQQYSVKPGGPNTLAMASWLTQEGSATASNANRLYQFSYIRVINNAKSVREDAAAAEDWGTYLVATVYRAMAYQMLADGFGETPYTEAENTSITAPKYDEGKTVYEGIISDLDEALEKVSSTDKACDNMLFKTNNIDNWIRFANSLKLRVLMRESGAVDVKSALASLVAEDHFITADVLFASSLFANQAGQDNPLFDQFVRGAGDINSGRSQDLAGHMAVISAMQEVNDPRLAKKFNASVGSGLYEGDFIDTQHSVDISSKYCSADSYSEPVLKFNTPVYLMTLAEVDFFLAEYYAKFGNNAAKAKDYYEAAVKASFAQAGAEGSEDILAGKYAWNASKADELIGIQKWIALANVNGFESWCELRRLGYPEFNSKTGAAVYAKWTELAKNNVANNVADPTPKVADLVEAGVYTYGKILTPQSATEIADNTIIGRLPYANTSTTRNANVPKQKEKGEKVFWAK